MTDKEAMKLALDALESCTPLDTSSSHVIYPWYDEKLVDKAITALKERLAQPEQEPVAWPCLIDSADFSENTITLVMQCEDYKVSAGTHWLSTTPPQRTWVGLTNQERSECWDTIPERAMKKVEAKLKEKNQ